ncbi:hypothetical protein L0U88_01615 [Flavihumibacter sp. RY-1]|uniref:Type II restriction endonuclease EcoO109IR domain-containing protein n=1 Tax=Flavihumibacter fluminis TaxID=2909236 RepID=A0ABS9BCF8_9BACT|nr:PmeII family type II restriction endonuclease [Flavihumibacter fluminis]MCF1713323.1 hypothetical protein [Flavihumibacter fluminis]
MNEQELIATITEYFKLNIFDNHLKASISIHTKLKTYKINPIIVKYLSKILENDFTAIGVAKALYYPRVLGTSISTIFGSRIQNMFVDIGLANGSLIKGMDIEFIDKLDDRKKWCQLKAGPNTINSEDVSPLIRKFTDTINLARTNSAFRNINNTDFIVGVIYGQSEELSMHYRTINKIHPVYIGNEFWFRLTGYEHFYTNLVSDLHDLILRLDSNNVISSGIELLASEISNSHLFTFDNP